MSQQYPQQPGWGQQPQHPQQQPGWGTPQQQPTQWGAPHQQPQPQPQPGWSTPPPQPPKKNSTGKIIGLGCAGVFALFVIIGIFSAALGGDSDDSSKGSTVSSEPTAADEGAGEDTAADAEAEKEEPAEAKPSDKPKADEVKKEEPQKVVFKVWGTAPAGALGPLDITYGSDSDSRKGTFKNGKFEATLPLNDDALYFNVMAQLQGSGDINCSVTVDGETKKAHASGDYNICHAQANAGLLGGWD
ncbi:hypothetical protein G5C60_04500 [Streptomyces sp. HC44]|uniref:Uncharacterized protein n=1 Tax=Streptomyces scabichelini TaxID=2711217 RepID=A0A6G4UYW1_9ACTN|nr:MmpS family transport accessory protein [Streptomyces scabichelini]NGO06939.1 hypothetical protein [Streptomyces scabichelini]